MENETNATVGVDTVAAPTVGTQVARPLPTSSSAIALLRKGNKSATLNDLVEDLWVQGFDDVPNFAALNNGTKLDKQFVEGSEKADDYTVAHLIRELAAGQPKYTPVAVATLEQVRRAVLVVRGRYNSRRNQLIEG